MKIFAALSLSLSTAFVIFLAFAFTNASLDISLWSEGWRFACAVGMLGGSVFVGLMAATAPNNF